LGRQAQQLLLILASDYVPLGIRIGRGGLYSFDVVYAWFCDLSKSFGSSN
jgi:hypothetical protein